MEFTINNCMTRINQALNYPSISYEDVSHFFDQAVSELNTSFRISIPLVSQMISEHTFKIQDHNVVLLNKDPGSLITKVSSKPTASDNSPPVYYKGISNLNYVFYVKTLNNEYEERSEVYGYIPAEGKAYCATAVDANTAFWFKIDSESLSSFSLTEYLPAEWLVLFVIPYVCFKFSVRNGDGGVVFNDEFIQGFQQLQTSYNVPNSVQLCKVAHLPAYRNLVKENIHDLNKTVPLRAVTEDMKSTNFIIPQYSSTHSVGGWGI